ncbi:LuxR family transcriptional regulator [Nereida sp. MMG025]|uniref:helix-turn-helix transcriptional regulator n=1 Tax=Nereida sp. MMG025 TaxID=2909981 RepID=UPI001F464E0C|nr:LuxR family transcriptional regulator [Nereida sp. MMG025]MCF6445519.1 LuxR family transcriptional regulator [Nereida sp. MMG025]
MASGLEKQLHLLEQATTLEHLQQATLHLRDHFGLAHFIYHWVNSVGERFGAGTYSSDWVDRYLEKDYLRMDPVILGCITRFHPTNWKDLDWSSKAAKAFLREAIDYGVGNQGLTIPVRGPSGQFALLTCNQTCDDPAWEHFIANHQQDLILIAHQFNRKALEFDTGFEAQAPSLSPRELSAIALLAKGFSRAQAAQDLSISEHTLRVYVEGARHKLGAINTTHAVARALSNGLIVV